MNVVDSAQIRPSQVSNPELLDRDASTLPLDLSYYMLGCLYKCISVVDSADAGVACL